MQTVYCHLQCFRLMRQQYLWSVTEWERYDDFIWTRSLYRVSEPRRLIRRTAGGPFPKDLHDGTYSLVIEAPQKRPAATRQSVWIYQNDRQMFASEMFNKFYNATFTILNGTASAISASIDGQKTPSFFWDAQKPSSGNGDSQLGTGAVFAISIASFFSLVGSFVLLQTFCRNSTKGKNSTHQLVQ